MSTKDEGLTVSQNGQQTDVSGSFIIRSITKEVEFLNYYDGSIEISISEYGECLTKMLSKEETQNLIDWLVKNCR